MTHWIKISSWVVMAILAGCSAAQPAADTATLLPPTTTVVPTAQPTQTASPSPLPPTETPAPTATPAEIQTFTFAVFADMRQYTGPGEYDTPQYFRGAVEAIAELERPVFLITPGDIDNPWNSRWTIDQVLGEDMIWFAGIGNHEHLQESMEWLRDYQPDNNGEVQPNIVNVGPDSCPQTTYSFDYGNAHFIQLNLYCDALNDMTKNALVGGTLYNWLKADLESTTKEHIFVIGHEPAFPQPDQDIGRLRHDGISLDEDPQSRDKFWALLKEYGVRAYLCGHTHNYSVTNIDGMWQIDVGHARGMGDPEVPSTFVVMRVDGDKVQYETYRSNGGAEEYTIRYAGLLTE